MLEFKVIEDNVSDEVQLPENKGFDGNGFLCCSTIVVDDGFIGISIPF